MVNVLCKQAKNTPIDAYKPKFIAMHCDKLTYSLYFYPSYSIENPEKKINCLLTDRMH